MTEELYYQKYLKYKHKYTKLRDEMDGGFWKRKTNEEKQIEPEKNNMIQLIKGAKTNDALMDVRKNIAKVYFTKVNNDIAKIKNTQNKQLKIQQIRDDFYTPYISQYCKTEISI